MTDHPMTRPWDEQEAARLRAIHEPPPPHIPCETCGCPDSNYCVICGYIGCDPEGAA